MSINKIMRSLILPHYKNKRERWQTAKRIFKWGYGMKQNKYSYYKIIQQNFGYHYGFEDVDAHECNSSGFMTSQQRAAYRENLKAYRENSLYPIRVIFRRELNV